MGKSWWKGSAAEGYLLGHLWHFCHTSAGCEMPIFLDRCKKITLVPTVHTAWNMMFHDYISRHAICAYRDQRSHLHRLFVLSIIILHEFENKTGANVYSRDNLMTSHREDQTCVKSHTMRSLKIWRRRASARLDAIITMTTDTNIGRSRKASLSHVMWAFSGRPRRIGSTGNVITTSARKNTTHANVSCFICTLSTRKNTTGHNLRPVVW